MQRGISTGLTGRRRIENCSNYGKMQGYIAAGITTDRGTSIINNCANYQEVRGKINSGGISASSSSYELNIYNCFNLANISVDSSYVGGISSDATNVVNCYNTGKITNQSSIAGGLIANSDKVFNCFNSGEVTLNGTFGYACGIAGIGKANAENCYNIGTVKSGTIATGITGGMSAIKCYNSGRITGGKSPTGGIGGYNVSASECYNTGDITNSDNSQLGEIATSSATIQNCYYLEKTNNAPANGATAKSKAEMDQIMDMQKFVDLLNQKVDEYNSQDTKEVELVKWKLKDGKPVFITEKD